VAVAYEHTAAPIPYPFLLKEGVSFTPGQATPLTLLQELFAQAVAIEWLDRLSHA
jgi:hypothetical protein